MVRDREKIEWSWSSSPILLPTDYETKEKNAFLVAFYLAEYSGSEVIVLHVSSPDEHPLHKRSVLEDLSGLGEKLGVKYRVVEVQSKNPFPSFSEVARDIVEEAKKEHCQAIVMAAHRESFFVELFGRISDRVARLAKSKVILVETPYPGLGLPQTPDRILIPLLSDEHRPDPFIVAAALTSSASAPEVKLQAIRVIRLPPTTPLDAIEVSPSLRKLEKDFSAWVNQSTRALGIPFSSFPLVVREAGSEVSNYARDISADIMVLSCLKPGGMKGLLRREEYQIVRKAPCVVLVVFPEKA